MIEACGMSRSEEGLQGCIGSYSGAAGAVLPRRCRADSDSMATALEYAGRVADFLEFGEVMCHDALTRDESCGAHFRVEHQTDDGEALRDDENYCNVSAWEFHGIDERPNSARGVSGDGQRGTCGEELPMINLNLHVWRQDGPDKKGRMVAYQAQDLSTDMSVLEMLDQVNEELIQAGNDPIVFDHDCREGICGSCSMVINGVPHGPEKASTTCQTFLRSFEDGRTSISNRFERRRFLYQRSDG